MKSHLLTKIILELASMNMNKNPTTIFYIQLGYISRLGLLIFRARILD